MILQIRVIGWSRTGQIKGSNWGQIVSKEMTSSYQHI